MLKSYNTGQPANQGVGWGNGSSKVVYLSPRKITPLEGWAKRVPFSLCEFDLHPQEYDFWPPKYFARGTALQQTELCIVHMTLAFQWQLECACSVIQNCGSILDAL